ncbi:MAG: hypothetical protein IJS29_10620 [Selenomonadaceae bacterium]|nr:hypothetical protein [Selenomonadaceae bacterium]
MKKIFSIITLASFLMLNFSSCFAKDVWVYKYPNGNSLYIVYESVVYGVRAGFYAYFRVKHVNSYGKIIKTEKWEMNRDEGDWWYGIEGVSRSRRVYDYDDATEVLNWLKEHESETQNTSRPYEKILR